MGPRDYHSSMRCLVTPRSIILFLLALAPLFAQKPADDAAIRDLVKRYVDAREKGDPKAVEALFTSDSDQLVSNGQWRKGRNELVKGTLASSEANSGKRTIAVEAVRFLSPDVAIADGRYEIGGMAEARKMWTTIICARKPEGWRIAAIRNMLPAK